jgi:hypothetical protein
MDPVTIIAYLAVMVATYFISAALAPSAAKPDKAALTDFDFPQFDEGTPQSVVFGDVWSADFFILGIGDYRTEDIKSDGGGK